MISKGGPTVKKLTVGLLAHVDAGKTTLSEALLYHAGAIRSLGSVNSGSTVMDAHVLEKQRGITIFTGTASLDYADCRITLLDTPGHIDFSAEAERSIAALDAAILVISGSDGVQAHSATLWHLLEEYAVPTLIFVSKMDLSRFAEDELMNGLTRELSPCAVRFDVGRAAIEEACALTDEALLGRFTEEGGFSDAFLASLIRERRLFPCFFGSGLRDIGTDALLDTLRLLAFPYPTEGEPRALCFKISHDSAENRLTHIKLTRGQLRVRDTVSYLDGRGESRSEKITQIRLIKGGRFQQTDAIEAGDIAALAGISAMPSGSWLGTDNAAASDEAVPADPLLKPVMTFRLELAPGEDPKLALPKLQKLSDEDPSLRIRWNSDLKEIEADLMGDIQTEVLESLAQERFGLRIRVCEGRILYKETISAAVEGIGHFEPLRHYAEVHLLMEPLPSGSGLHFATALSEDKLARNWQRLILTHLAEKEHRGVLTGAPLTDMSLTLVAGRAHEKHTEGGDFRQATYRAVRQGLMQARAEGHCVLLEPLYAFRLEIPAEFLGRAMSDLHLRHAEMSAPEGADPVLLKGTAPVRELNGYARELASFSGGRASFSLEPAGYTPCRKAEELIEGAAYDPLADTANTPDSVFCSHGAGHTVPWQEVPSYMHLPLLGEDKEAEPTNAGGRKLFRSALDDRELEAIMLREFGPIKRPLFTREERRLYLAEQSEPVHLGNDSFFIVDGYNVIFAWDELREIAAEHLGLARDRLITALVNYQAFTACQMIVVFDGYRRPENVGERTEVGGVHVVYTREHETADAYIERFVTELGKDERVRVVTSDALIQLSAVRAGVLRMSSREFRGELGRVLHEIDLFMEKLTNNS